MTLKWTCLALVLALSPIGCKAKPLVPIEATPADQDAGLIPGELDGRMDVCSFNGTEKPANLFPHYAENKYDGNWLLPGKSMFFDKLDKFRCGSFRLDNGTGEGAYSTDNVLFITSKDESNIRLVRLTFGTPAQMKAISEAFTTVHGEGKVIHSTKKTKGDRSIGEEVRLVQSGLHNFYIDTVYLGDNYVGSIVIVRPDDVEENKALVADMTASAKK